MPPDTLKDKTTPFLLTLSNFMETSITYVPFYEYTPFSVCIDKPTVTGHWDWLTHWPLGDFNLI